MSTGSRPRIGITCGDDRIDEYRQAVEQAGAVVVALARDDPTSMLASSDLDGIVFSGGGDVAPLRYGQPPHAETEEVSQVRDDFEFALLRATFDARLPTLAICRGVQVANVALGGTLHQHVPDVAGETVQHRRRENGTSLRGIFPDHLVALAPDSRLAAVVGPALATGSRHHQAIDRIAPSLRVVGRTSGGIVEAVEASAGTWFWLGVQWHPESTLDLDEGRSRALFRALVHAAAGRAQPS